MKPSCRFLAAAAFLAGGMLPGLLQAAPSVPTEAKPLGIFIWFGSQNGRLTAEKPLIYGEKQKFHYNSKGKLPSGAVAVQLVAQSEKGFLEGKYNKQFVLAHSEIVPLSAEQSADFEMTLPARGTFEFMQLGVFFFDAQGKRIENTIFQSEVRYPAVKVQQLSDMRDNPAFFRDTDGRLLWQTNQAKVLPSGNLEWTPRAETENLGKAIRYIDYESGDDSRDGKTPATAWKHHPWDAEAAALAKADTEADTYLFKRGVIYRGVLTGSRGGTRTTPLRLTSSSTYGKGKAVLLNAAPITSEWSKTDIPGVYKTQVGPCEGAPVVHLRDGLEMKRLWAARFPNFNYDNPDDARAGWLKIEKISGSNETPRVIENRKLMELPKDLTAETLLARMDWDGVMGFPNNYKVQSVDSAKGFFTAKAGKSTRVDCRFYLYNDLKLLDEPGEFYYDAEQGTLYVMPEKESDLKHLEFSSRKHGLSVEYADCVEVSNLTFMGGCDMRYLFSCWNFGYYRPAAVRILGCNGFTVRNCEFKHVPSGVFGTSPAFCVSDEFSVEDCDFYDCGTWAIRFGEGVIYRAKILRNRIRKTGYVGSSTMTCWLNVVHQAVVAGNFLSDCGSNGIDCYWGGGSAQDIPLIRGFIFQNRVEHSLRLVNDYGNIESWQVGPAYIYNNLSINPGGIWYPQIRRGGSPHFGFAYYLDGGFKTYLFNNIARGVCNDGKSVSSNTGAFQEIFGFNNKYFNNTMSKFEVGFRRQMPEGGRNDYLGNLFDDISMEFYQMDGWRQNMTGAAERIDFASNNYSGNLHRGTPKNFGRLLNRPTLPTQNAWRNELAARKSHSADFGSVVSEPTLRDPEKHDFRPARANGSGAIAFVPLSLYGCVGEWNFIQPDAGTEMLATDESMYPSMEFTSRNMYQIIPRADLTYRNVKNSDFIKGRCETWKPGAVKFNGIDQYAVSHQANILRDLNFRNFHFDGKNRRSFDMKRNSFTIEFVAAPKGGTLLAKHDDKNGYRVAFKGRNMFFETWCNGEKHTVRAEIPDEAPKFSHWMIEFDRAAQIVRFYCEGKSVSVETSGKFPADSLSNASDFFVGKDTDGGFFSGAIDFLRLSQGTLADSMTTAKEVHEWAFDGPNRRDFSGFPRGEKPDAGALQYR